MLQPLNGLALPGQQGGPGCGELDHPRRAPGTQQHEGLVRQSQGDRTVDATRVRRVLLCSGKVTFDLEAHREENGVDDVAIVRLDAGSVIEVDYYFSSALEPPDYHQRFATIVGH